MATNVPSRIQRVDVIPGISDHEAVNAELDMCPVRNRQKPRTIFLYKRANWEDLRSDMRTLLPHIRTMAQDRRTTVNDLWVNFRDSLKSRISRNIP